MICKNLHLEININGNLILIPFKQHISYCNKIKDEMKNEENKIINLQFYYAIKKLIYCILIINSFHFIENNNLYLMGKEFQYIEFSKNVLLIYELKKTITKQLQNNYNLIENDIDNYVNSNLLQIINDECIN